MSDELKACPLCKSPAFVDEDYENYCWCSNPHCKLNQPLIPMAQWQQRPLEDALRAERDRAVSMVERFVDVSKKIISHAYESEGNITTSSAGALMAIIAEWQAKEQK